MNTPLALALVNNVLRVVGEDSIASFISGDPLSDTANAIYEDTVRTLLDDTGLRWAQKYASLSLVVGDSPGRYAYVYQQPADCIAIRSVLVNGAEVDYDIYGDKIITDYDSTSDVQLFYTYRVDEAAWPPKFSDAVRKSLKTQFLQSREKWREAEGVIQMEAEPAMKRARYSASVQRGGRDPWRSRLVAARRNRDR